MDNDIMTTHTIFVFEDGETWTGDGGCYRVECTDEEYERIMAGEKVRRVIPSATDPDKMVV